LDISYSTSPPLSPSPLKKRGNDYFIEGALAPSIYPNKRLYFVVGNNSRYVRGEFKRGIAPLEKSSSPSPHQGEGETGDRVNK